MGEVRIVRKSFFHPNRVEKGVSSCRFREIFPYLCSAGLINIPGIVNKGNVYGMQFHPEKSGEVGLKILKNFGVLSK